MLVHRTAAVAGQMQWQPVAGRNAPSPPPVYAVRPTGYQEEEPESRLTRFVGRQVQLQMRGGEDPGAVDEMTVDGEVVVQQQRLLPESEPQTTMEIRGKTLRVISLGNDRYRLFVAGDDRQLAVVSANELLLQGTAIHLDQSANRLWIEGAGKMHLDGKAGGNGMETPPGRSVFQAVSDSTQTSAPGSGVTTVDWRGGMVFDGQKIYFETDVHSHSRQASRTDGSVTITNTRSAALSIALTRRIDFGQRQLPPADSDIKAEKLVMVGWMSAGDVAFPKTWQPAEDRRVQVATEKYDVAGAIVSNQEVHAPRATFDVVTGRVNCKGPGSIIVRQKAGSDSSGGVPANLASGGKRSGNIDFVKVDFDSRFDGNLENRELHFHGNVHTFYVDISQWHATPDESVIRRPGNRGMIMDCDNLVLAQWTPQSGEPTLEMTATGNARIRGSQFDASAERISYTQMTNLLVIEAPNRSNAELRFSRPGQTNRGLMVAKTITYNLVTGETQVQEMKQMDYSQQGSLRSSR